MYIYTSIYMYVCMYDKEFWPKKQYGRKSVFGLLSSVYVNQTLSGRGCKFPETLRG